MSNRIAQRRIGGLQGVDEVILFIKNALFSLSDEPNKQRAFMALDEKIDGVRAPYSARFSNVYGVFAIATKSLKTVAPQSEIGHLAGLQLQGQFVSDKGNKFRIRGFSLGIADGIAEKSLQSIQIPSVPGYFDCMPDGSFHTAWGGLECFCHLGVEYLGDGVGVPYGPPGGLAGCS